MPGTDYIQTGFNAGELSPQMRGQLDIAKYSSGVDILKNFVCLAHGPVQNRPGTEFIAEVKDSSKFTRLIPFIASLDSAYIIEMGENYIRFCTTDGQVAEQELIRNGHMEEDDYWFTGTTHTTKVDRDTQHVYDGTYAMKRTTTAAGQGIFSDYWEYPGSASSNSNIEDGTVLNCSLWVYAGVTSINVYINAYDDDSSYFDIYDTNHAISANQWVNITFQVTVNVPTGADCFRIYLAIRATAADPATTFWLDKVSLKATRTCEIHSDFAENDLIEIDFAQSIDEIFMAHNSYFPKKLITYGEDFWKYEEIDFAPEIVGSSGTALGIEWILSGSGTNEFYMQLIGGGDPGFGIPFAIIYDPGTWILEFKKGTIGSLATYEWNLGDNDSLGFNTIYMRTGVATDPDSLSNIKMRQYDSSLWNEGAAYPSSVFFHGDRLCWTVGETIHMSQVSLYYDFTSHETVVDSDGIHLRLGDGQLSNILWGRSFKGVSLFTPTNEWSLTGSDGIGIITANSKKADIASNNSSDKVRPVILNNSIIYVLRHKKIMKEFIYDFASEAFSGNELTIFAEHLTRNYGITDLAYQQTPYKILWAVREDGVLLGLTYYPQHKVFGWHRHEIGGNGIVESIAVIPGSGYDELWMVVRRTIDGSTVRYIERLNPFFVKPEWDVEYFMDDDLTDAQFLDSSLTLDNRINITDISSADPAVVTTSAAHTWSNGDTIIIRNVKGVTDTTAVIRYKDDVDSTPVYGQSAVNGYEFTVANVGAQTAELKLDGEDFDSTAMSDYISGGTAAKKVTAITGLDHLEGETVSILGDGNVLTEQEVSGGAINLDEAASVVHVGLPYESDLQTLPPRLSQQVGTYQAVTKQIQAFTLRLFETSGLYVGRNEDNLVAMEWVDDTVSAGHPIPCFTGDTEEQGFSGQFTTNPTIFIRQSDPLPATISALIMQLEA